jgi:uncharacterized protein YcnI
MKLAVVSATTAAVSLAFAQTAFAHALVSPPVAKSKVLQQFTLSVPTEKEGVTTTAVQLFVPEGFHIDSFEPSPGWTRSEEAGAASGYTWAGGHVPTDEDAVFRFNASLDSNKRYTLKVRQSYSDGSFVDWNGPESSDAPAPLVDGVASLGEGGGGTTTLTIIALIVGAIGVVLGIVALATRGRPLA